jgi:predicted nucleic acid-binding Zn ribbon protein
MHSVVSDILRKAPLSPEKVTLAWKLAAGPALARVTEVALDEGGRLHVRAADAHWRTEVRRATRLLLPRLAGTLGAGVVRTIDVEGD